MADSLRVLLISGSLRDGSVNTAVLRTAKLLAGQRVTATLYTEMGALPHFNPDDDLDSADLAPAVTRLRKQLGESDAVLLCTPEYAGALPGSFRNLLDWTVGGGETYGKPMAWINASSRLVPDAAAGAHRSLRAVLSYTGVEIVEAACRRIVVPRDAIGADGIVADPSIRRQIGESVLTLAEHTVEPAGRPASQTEELSIGKLKPSDREEWETLYRAYMAFCERTPPDELYDVSWRALVEDRDVHALGARLDGALVGIVHFLMHARTSQSTVCYLEDLYTASHARGHGVARALIAAVTARARRQGCSRVYWLTNHSNRTARALYDQVATHNGSISYEIVL